MKSYSNHKVKDNAEPRYTKPAGTSSGGGTYTCRNDKPKTKDTSSKPLG